jgi:hypothetical protein
MEKYNYLESVKEDVKNYISDHFDEKKSKSVSEMIGANFINHFMTICLYRTA